MSSINESIIKIRVELQNSKIKKSGKNEFSGFTYYELSDFLPKLNELMLKEKVNDCITIQDNVITLTLFKGEEAQTYSMPFIIYDTPLAKSGQKSMQDIQYLGALNTYYKRYLYLNAFGITDGEVIDSMNNEEVPKQQKQQKQQKQFKPTASGMPEPDDYLKYQNLSKELLSVNVDIKSQAVIDFVCQKANVKSIKMDSLSQVDIHNVLAVFERILAQKKG